VHTTQPYLTDKQLLCRLTFPPKAILKPDLAMFTVNEFLSSTNLSFNGKHGMPINTQLSRKVDIPHYFFSFIRQAYMTADSRMPNCMCRR